QLGVSDRGTVGESGATKGTGPGWPGARPPRIRLAGHRPPAPGVLRRITGRTEGPGVRGGSNIQSGTQYRVRSTACTVQFAPYRVSSPPNSGTGRPRRLFIPAQLSPPPVVPGWCPLSPLFPPAVPQALPHSPAPPVGAQPADASGGRTAHDPRPASRRS